MAARGSRPLYTPELLALAVELADYPLGDELALRGEAVSRTCGSTVALGLTLGADGAIERVGMRCAACAVGQAAAAIFARGAAGRDAENVTRAEAQLARWLDGGPEPEWPGVAVLSPAREHLGRHGAILLPWRAASAVLSNAAVAG